MKIRDFLENGKFFPLMGFSQLNELGDMLDSMLNNEYGLRSCGTIITRKVVDGKISDADMKAIAKEVYFRYKNKWDSLAKFAEDEVVGEYFNKEEVQTTEYGKVVDHTNKGEDVMDTGVKIAGFNSEDMVDKDSEKHTTKYGKTTKASDSGTDVVKIQSRTMSKEMLVGNLINFWDNYGLARTVIADSLKVIALPLYDLDDIE